MKFRITFKDPDGVSNSIQEESLNLAQNSLTENLRTNEKLLEPLVEHFKEELESKIEKWIEYNEYLTIEFDTDANTCTVIPV